MSYANAQGLGAASGGSAGVGFGAIPPGTRTEPTEHHIGSDKAYAGKWRLYDEKYRFQSKALYCSKEPQMWFHDLRDYLAGRTAELDDLFDWIEGKSERIDRADEGDHLCIDCADTTELSRQLWALLGGLVKEDASVKRTFANVPRHNGFEAWRRIHEPVREDKALRRKDLLLKVTNPRAASGINDLAKALEDWETSKREFEEADGARQTDDSERLVFLDLIPQEISAHVIMHMDMPGYATYDAIRRYALKMVKVLQNQKRKPGGINAVTEQQRMGMQPAAGTDFGEEVEEEEVELPSMAEICAFMASDPPAAEVNAFMKGRFVRKGPAGGQRGAGGRFQPGNGGGFKPGGAGAGARPPPRGASDMSCVNCGIKGHMAAECRKPKADRKDQPCFTCGKTGHQSRACPMKGQLPIKAIEDAKDPRSPVFCGCVSLADEHGFKTVLKGPRPQQQGAVVADFLRTPTGRLPRREQRIPIAIGL